uniref:S1 motif domain-containing protein n=1 Tax=Odontella aurita TaxID=265563 RepID=A0A7S4JMR3_9STRA|eukprot:CAMPEP_0113555628 /NCGR_PEP_ID=MMETSP0015_2-20120614/16820_1 /TAXON_ID=2838 /ORGANISM="Odontella" /LENGTH=228 /DNA_ID=CAMNT_0000456921 /DNA_START=46 /DNA_END=732 /DNA_ORIENTATION=+ /assembly_acc=CAM_ASM_000160
MTPPAIAPPRLRHPIGCTVCPGDRLGTSRQIFPGRGSYERGGNVYASVVGTLAVSQLDDPPAGSGKGRSAKHQVIVVPEGGKPYISDRVLTVGKVVLGKVARVINNQAFVEIVAAEGVGALGESFSGVVRKEDVRAGASEEVDLYGSFRPGDVVLCRIISPGDSRRYGLSTAENELGVVRATCAGNPMTPVNWREMECTVTGKKEKRKVAKPREMGASEGNEDMDTES